MVTNIALPGGAPVMVVTGTVKIAAGKVLATSDSADMVASDMRTSFNSSVLGGSDLSASMVEKSQNFTSVKVGDIF